ncbi:MAG: hypothetical protein ACOX6S_13675 [Clostridia bacterium]
MKRAFVLTLVAVLFVSLLLTGCGKQSSPEPSQAPGESEAPVETEAPAGTEDVEMTGYKQSPMLDGKDLPRWKSGYRRSPRFTTKCRKICWISKWEPTEEHYEPLLR